MHVGTGDGIARDHLAASVGLDMVLAVVAGRVSLLRPSRVGVFWAQLACVLLRLPFLGDAAVLDAGVLVPGVPLVRGIHEGCVDDGAGMGYDAGVFELFCEGIEQPPDGMGIGKGSAKGPVGLGVGDAVLYVEAEEAHDGDAVVDLAFKLARR